jgi:hypothetical protein
MMKNGGRRKAEGGGKNGRIGKSMQNNMLLKSDEY